MDSSALALAQAMLVARGDAAACDAAIPLVLARFGVGALRFAFMRSIRVVPMRRRERYAEASPAIARMGAAVDAWPAPPAGLFVVEERCIYVRSRSPMTIAHEFGHALDCALGGGVYRSGIDARVRDAYANAREFVTPYAATALDEYFAESLRAYVEINDPASLWPRATRTRLQRIDPVIHAYIAAVFDEFERTEAA